MYECHLSIYISRNLMCTKKTRNLCRYIEFSVLLIDYWYLCRYIEFYDAMSVPMAIALSGRLLFGQPVMVKPSEAEKNLVQSTASGTGSGLAGPNAASERKLYVGNLHFNMTELQLRQVSRL